MACAAACKDQDCCFVHEGLTCDNGSNPDVTVEPLDETPELPTGVIAASDPLRVTFCNPNFPSPVRLGFAIDERELGDAFVLRMDDDGNATLVQATQEGDTLAVEIDENGVYLAVAFELPDGCETETFDGSVDALVNDDLEQLEGVTRLSGGLSLGAEVSSVEALRCLTWITGSLMVGETELNALDLAALMRVDERLLVQPDSDLEEIDLGHLSFVAAVDTPFLMFDELPALVRLDLGNLVTAPGSLYISNLGTGAEQSLELDLSSLTTVRSMLAIQATTLETLDGLVSLERVGELVITENAELKQIDALSSLTSVSANVWIVDNPVLASADLGALNSIHGADVGSLVFANLPELVQLDLGSVEVTGPIQLTDIGAGTRKPLTLGLGALNSVRGDLTLTSVANLVDVEAFEALESVVGSLAVSKNPELTNLDGFGALASVDGDLAITDNSALPTCTASELRDRLEDAGFDGAATISGNLPAACD